MSRTDDEAAPRRGRDPGVGPSRGRAFVYVLPCRYEDILKLGFSRDPLDRVQTLHARWFDFFDLDAAFFVETDRVADARRLERVLGTSIALHNAPAPLIVPSAAGGANEWYRGAYALLAAAAATLEARDGYAVHRPAVDWLRRRLDERTSALYAWSTAALELIRSIERMPPDYAAGPLTQTLRNALDAYAALDLAPQRRVGTDVWRWYAGAPARAGE